MKRVMNTIARDSSRDRRIEPVSNLWLVHPLAHALLPVALRVRAPANLISLIGLMLGAAAALAFAQWRVAGMPLVALAFAVAWLVADGLDGMVARATGTASALGRLLDGVCDHGSFILMYVAVALSIGTVEGWVLAVAGGAAHALQSNLYETERARYHRRVRGVFEVAEQPRTGSRLERGYDRIAALGEARALRFDQAMARGGENTRRSAERYGRAAAAPMRAMALLSANTRIVTLTVACLIGAPALFWWFELVVLSAVALMTFLWHRRVEDMTAG